MRSADGQEEHRELACATSKRRKERGLARLLYGLGHSFRRRADRADPRRRFRLDRRDRGGARRRAAAQRRHRSRGRRERRALFQAGGQSRDDRALHAAGRRTTAPKRERPRGPLAGKTFVLTGTLPNLTREEATRAHRSRRRQSDGIGEQEDRLRRRRRTKPGASWQSRATGHHDPGRSRPARTSCA